MTIQKKLRTQLLNTIRANGGHYNFIRPLPHTVKALQELELEGKIEHAGTDPEHVFTYKLKENNPAT